MNGGMAFEFQAKDAVGVQDTQESGLEMCGAPIEKGAIFKAGKPAYSFVVRMIKGTKMVIIMEQEGASEKTKERAKEEKKYD
jgi:hypothetical protein